MNRADDVLKVSVRANRSQFRLMPQGGPETVTVELSWTHTLRMCNW